MIRILLLLLAGVFCAQGIAQDPRLIESNWFIDYITIDGVTTPSPIESIIGIPQENIIFEADYAAAIMHPESDSFAADVIYDPVNPNLSFIKPHITLPGCQAYCEFAAAYMEMLAGDFVQSDFEYSIVENSDGTKGLTITSVDGDVAVFNDFPPLGLDDFENIKVVLYPNPAQEILTIFSQNVRIESMIIYDIWGKKISERKYNNNAIDVYTLSQGIYFLEIYSENGKTVKRFVKD